MEKQIREVNVIPRPAYTNPALQQRIANMGNSTNQNWYGSNYTDDDMLIIAEMLKNNTVSQYETVTVSRIICFASIHLCDKVRFFSIPKNYSFKFDNIVKS